jgi:hypothetical protein
VTKRHALAISLLLGLAVVVGVLATVRTTGLAQRSSSASAETVSARKQRLDRLQAQIQQALANRPPALPAARSTPATQAPRITYVRAERAVAAASFEDDEHEDDEHEDQWDEESDD